MRFLRGTPMCEPAGWREDTYLKELDPQLEQDCRLESRLEYPCHGYRSPL